MIYYLLIFISTSLISVGIILLKKPFFPFALATTAQLNIMLDTSLSESEKQKILIHNLKKLVSTFGLFLILLCLMLGVALIPIYLYVWFNDLGIHALEMKSFYFFGSMILGSFVFFVFPLKKKKKDYSDWSVLLHKMVLDNYNISKSLFRLEKWLFKNKTNPTSENFVIVTGLARAGTTALTKLLFQSNKFHSLSYANMPFLLAVNIWGKFYNPKKSKLKQRAHGDRVMFGYNTIEALEEYFFKAFMNDNFIDEKTLIPHSIDEETYHSYLVYQNLVKPKNAESTYLAKNNNLILRVDSLRKLNPEFKIVLIFRYPEYHALSLLNQHLHFSELQNSDAFVLDYMNWLGHHEFGLNHKPFDLGMMELCNQYEPTSINYWIAQWISYNTRVLSLLEDKNIILIDYSDLLNAPEQLMKTLGNALKIDIQLDEIESFKKSNIKKVFIDPKLEKQSILLYEELTKHKLDVSR